MKIGVQLRAGVMQLHKLVHGLLRGRCAGFIASEQLIGNRARFTIPAGSPGSFRQSVIACAGHQPARPYSIQLREDSAGCKVFRNRQSPWIASLTVRLRAGSFSGARLTTYSSDPWRSWAWKICPRTGIDGFKRHLPRQSTNRKN